MSINMKNITFKLLAGLLLCSLVMMSCNSPGGVKADDEEPVDGYRGMNVPANFNFSTTVPVTLNLGAHNITARGTVVEIYNANPHHGEGRLIRRVFVKQGAMYPLKLNMPGHVQDIWIVSRQNDGIIITHKVPSVAGTRNVDLAEVGPITMGMFNAGLMSTGLDCNSGCDQFVSGSNLTISDGQVHCVQQGESISGNLTFSGNGGELRVCGSAQLQNINVNGNPSTLDIYITESGVFQINTMNLNSSHANLTNRGTLQISNGLSFNYRFENYSTLNIQPFNVNSNGGEFYNYGTINVSDNFNNNNFVHNFGTIVTTGYFNNNGTSELINECSITANAGFHQNGDMQHNGYIQTNGTFYVQQGGNRFSKMASGALVEANNAIINQELEAPQTGTYSRLNIGDELRINGGGSITGLMDVCVDSGSIINNGSISNTVTYCEAYIPANECNPGAGIPGGGGGDGDNPPDDEDEYPEDPDRTFNNPFPAAGVFGTLAYEDLWPGYGDYDMNDVVVGYHINEVSNDDNDIVDIEFTMVIRALGASLQSGFGVELNVAPSRVQSVSGTRYTENLITLSGNGTEAGQSNAVIIFWDNSGHEMGYYVNTENPANHVAEDTLQIKVTFNPPVSPAELGQAPYKPFIFVGGERGREVHLPGNAPTSLVDASLFGTFDDNTNPAQNRFYLSNDNLNWAIHIPETIPYPLERVEISDAYLKFKNWAESGGQVDTDWYLDLPGHRVPAKLYVRP